MNHNGVQSADFQHHHVAGKLLGELAVHHGMAAIFHHDDLVVIPLQEWQRFRQDAGGLGDGNVGHLNESGARVAAL